MPSIERKPLPDDALSSARLRPPQRRGLAAAMLLVGVFEPRGALAGSAWLGLFRAPHCLWKRAPETSTPFADFCNHFDARAHPVELPTLAREWRLSPPLLAGTKPVPVASVTGAHCHASDLRAATPRAPTFVRRAPLARDRRITGRCARAKANARS